jgi:predicted 2-oxoglutarate/Fe(II)-dependent dioxygenase YbiX
MTGLGLLTTTLDEFLVLQELTWVDRFIFDSAGSFQPAQVFRPDTGAAGVVPNHRSARNMAAPDWINRLFQQRLGFHLRFILESLNYPAYTPQRLEAQIAASNDGDFFGRHNDDKDANVATREITFVFFCHREPRAFEGGELVIYGCGQSGPKPVRIEPVRNRMVLFPSFLVHEVLPVKCPSREFTDSRLTVNGWIHGPADKQERQGRWLQQLAASSDNGAGDF